MAELVDAPEPGSVESLAQWLAEYPSNAMHPAADQAHKDHIDALIARGGIAEAEAAYGLRPVRDLPDDPPEPGVLCCLAVRDERPRLPQFLTHYRRLGVARFLVVDNGSTDGTLEYLLEQTDVSVWTSDLRFDRSNCGSVWFQVLLRRHGRGRWTLIVDADEYFWFPDCETRDLIDLCTKLDDNGLRAYPAVLLDMYSDGPIRETHLPSGEPPWSRCRFYDRQLQHVVAPGAGPFANQAGYFGGVRRRVFGGGTFDYCLNKVPLLRYDDDCVLAT